MEPSPGIPGTPLSYLRAVLPSGAANRGGGSVHVDTGKPSSTLGEKAAARGYFEVPRPWALENNSSPILCE